MPERKKVAVVERWPLAEVRLYLKGLEGRLHPTKHSSFPAVSNSLPCVGWFICVFCRSEGLLIV